MCLRGSLRYGPWMQRQIRGRRQVSGWAGARRGEERHSLRKRGNAANVGNGKRMGHVFAEIPSI